MFTYSRDFLNHVRQLCEYSTKFNRTVVNRIKRIRRKAWGKTRKHRAGWQVALRRQPISKIQIPMAISTNIRSLMGKIDEVKLLLRKPECTSLGVMMIQETWLHEDIDDEIIQVEGFKIFRSDRKCKISNRGGGVLTLVRNDWCKSHKLLFDYSSTKINCLIVECKPKFLSGFTTIVYGNIYLAPDVSPNEFKDFSVTLTTTLVQKVDTSLCVIAGDFNRCDKVFLTSIGLLNIIDFPTRLDATLDCVFTNRGQLFTARRCAPLSTSDHCIIKVCPKTAAKSSRNVLLLNRQRIVRQRNCSKENLEQLRAMIASTDFGLFHSEDPSSYCETLTDYLNFCFDLCCPVECIHIRADRFSSPILKKLRRQKEVAYKNGKRETVKQTSVLIKTEIKRLNEIYVATILGDDNYRGVWKALKRLSGYKTKNNENVTDVEELNKQFTPQHAEVTLPNYIGCCPVDIVNPTNVYKHLRQTKPNKSPGPDELSPVLLKSCADSLCFPLAELFNDCLAAGKIPDSWKVAKITPIPKKESGKFRPIVCTSVLLKTFEKSLFDLLPTTLTDDDPMQFAFKKSRSTLDSLSVLIHSISYSLDQRQKSFRMLFLDYKNAFGCVDQKVLLEDLFQSGTDTTVCRILKDYFSDRRQYTTFCGKSSSSLFINTGVPQGAILSPTFFSFYVKHLPIPSDFLVCKYADDIVFGGSGETQPLQEALDQIVCWSSFRGLYLNVDKCQDIIFSLSKSRPHAMDTPPPVQISLNPMPRVFYVNYLGVILSNNLSWSPHIFEIFCKVRRLTFYTLRLRMLSVPHHLILKFINACILPLWLYCSPVIFAGLLHKDAHMISRSLRHLSKCSGVSFDYLVDTLISRHFDASSKFSRKILYDPTHPLYVYFSKVVSFSTTRSLFRLLPARTSSYRNSVLPYLARCLVNPEQCKSDLSLKLRS